MPGNLGGPTLLIILFIVLLLFGAPKLPALARSIGQSMKILRKEVSSDSKGEKSAGDAESAAGGSSSEAAAPAAAATAAPAAPAAPATPAPSAGDTLSAEEQLAQARAEAAAAKAEAEALRAAAEKRDGDAAKNS